MGWKHVGLRDGNRFQDAVATFVVAQMVTQHSIPQVRLEDGGDQWGDIVVTEALGGRDSGDPAPRRPPAQGLRRVAQTARVSPYGRRCRAGER